ncbi:MAG: PQQ-binding-like beta-propeller repeat protein, partial [Planctomycetota bacterium]|nr:PQQ-binding-like beta-propeller repeat protein [Planctomycetota bacterium]
HYGNEFICVDLKTNKQLWKYVNRQQPFFSSPSLSSDRVVFGGRDKWLHCVKRSDGTRLWTFPTRRKIDGSPVICGDKVVFGSGDGRLYTVGLDDGRQIAQYEIGRPILSSPAVAGGMVLVGSNDGVLYAFRTRPDSDQKADDKAGNTGKR